jgi:Spy/CpxP family protein refolding chaperone
VGFHGPGRFQHKFGSFLDLSKEQKDKFREIRNRFRVDTRDLRYDLAQKRLEMRKLFTDPKTDDTILLAKQKEIEALLLKLMDRKAQIKIGWRKILTPEQIQKLDTLPHHGRGRDVVLGMR